METYLKHYKARITAKAPIFIGDGTKTGKKEFIYSERDEKVYIPDMGRFFSFLSSRGLEDAYTEYMLYSGNKDLGRWLYEQQIYRKEYLEFIAYTLDAGDALIDSGRGGNTKDSGAKAREILRFVKDAKGRPYVPGSSIKGMTRTALLAYEISNDEGLRERYKKNIHDDLAKIDQAGKSGAQNRRQDRKKLLSSQTQCLEQEVLHTIERYDPKKKEYIKKSNAVCSNMSGLIISDSVPLKTDALVLCQKIDFTKDGRENPLPILREALKPGTEIFFDLTIDSRIFPYDIKIILEALNKYQQAMYNSFYSRFGRGCSDEGTVWLGGGCGFPSKTVIDAICGKETVDYTARIFKTTVNNREHKHDLDVSGYGISPHVCKCTRYQNRLYDMGQGKIEIL